MTDGILLVAKPPGVSSFKALSAIKRSLGTRRIGHAGTLDPFAQGLLLVLAGSLTRLSQFASAMDKEYVARVTFGRTTDTLDPTGRETGTGPVPDRVSLEEALSGLTGEIQQVPPQFSAVQVAGRRAYAAARKGEEVQLASRTVTIHSLQLLDWSPPDAEIRVSCSKGTYIRALARDLALRLGSCGFLSDLTRTRIGGFLLEEAIPPESVGPDSLLPAAVFFEKGPAIPRLTVKDEWVTAITGGTPARQAFFTSRTPGQGYFGAFDRRGNLLAMVESREDGMRYAAVFPGGRLR